MNYYYDLTLDFLENNYYFYDITPNDSFMEIQKIPLFQVDSKVIKDFLLNKVKVDASFLELIKNKTIASNQVIAYATLLADKNNAWAFIFNEEGECIQYSSLTINEELNLLEVIYNVAKINISYEKIAKKPNPKFLRQEEKIKNLILEEITKLYHEHNLVKLQYLYLEWCEKLENNIEIIYQNMVKEINNSIGYQEEKISKLIELSYNHV